MKDKRRIVVRLAEMSDRGRLQGLMREFLVENAQNGSDILPTERSLAFLDEMVFAYIDTRLLGAVTVATVDDVLVGFVLAGETPSRGLPYDSALGKVAFGWGSWVHPAARRMGLARRMRELAVEELKRYRFETLTGGVHVGNPGAAAELAAFGAKPHLTQITINLR